MFASLTRIKQLVLLALCLSVILFTPLSIQAFSNLDSLKLHLPTSRDTLLFDQLINIARKSESPDSSLYYGQLALNLSIELKDQKREADAHYRLGQFYEDKGLADRSVEELDKAIEICKRIHYPMRHTFVHTQKGYVLNEAGKTEEALKSFLEGLEVAEQYGIKGREGHLLVDIGDFFRLQHNFTEALDYLERAKVLFESTDNQGGICRTLFTLGSTYFAMKGKAKKSIEANFEMLNGPCRKNSSMAFVGKIYNNIGGAYSKMEDFENAEKYLLKALKIKQKHSSTRSLLYTQNELTSLYLSTQKYDQALYYAEKSYENVQKTNNIYVEYDILRNLSLLNSKTEDYKQANYYNGLYNDLRDSIGNMSQAQALAEMRAQYETAKKEKEIVAAKFEAERYESRFKNLLLIGLLGLLLVITFFWWYRFRNRQKALETQRLIELDRMKSRYFANISHELRTPLSLIIDPLQQLAEKNRNPEQAELLRIAETNGKRMLQMLNQMLDLSKLQDGKMKLKVQKLDLHLMLKTTLSTFEPVAQQKDIHLRLISDVDQLFLYFDPDKLEKTLYNVLGNALKFTPQGGEVTLLLIERKTHAQISIRDNGIGISKEQQAFVFDRFYQVDDSNTRAYGGTGIGLALAKELVELHNGTIKLSSKEEKGTQVSILLPLGRKHLKDKQIVQSTIQSSDLFPNANPMVLIGDQQVSLPEKAPSKEEKAIILLIEDQAEMRRYISQQLSSQFQILEARDGQEGYALGIEEIPDLIICDVMLPGIDGIELCQRFKKDQKTSHIPIILLTAKAQQADKLKGLKAGADEYMYKPFSSQELLLRINRLIDQQLQLQQQISKGRGISPRKINVSSMDEQFLQNLMEIVENRMSDESFGVEELGKAIGISRSQLHRKIKALTGQSTNLFLREIRLKRALQLLKQEAGSAAEIAYQVGFSNPNYFYKCFKEQFGKTPGQVLKGEEV